MKGAKNWWFTSFGRSVAGGCIVAAATVSSVASFFPHTQLLSLYEDNMHLYEGGVKVDLPPVLKERFEKCLDILKLDDFHKKAQHPFSVFGFDLFHAGNWDTRKGAIIGIPSNYVCKSEHDLDKSNIQVGMKRVKWNTPAAEQLAQTLILPEHLQIFGICREILSTQNHQIHFNTFYSAAIILLTYNASRFTNDKLNLFQRSNVIRFTFYSLFGLFGLGLYFLSKDMTQMSVENDVDEKLCNLGPNFIKDGVDFYDNILKRNKALRELLGKEGESLYSGNGNDLFYFRQKTTPITERKKYFEEKLKQYENKS